MANITSQISQQGTFASPASSDATLLSISEADKTLVEPQNDLTRKFTEREWDALKRLRPRLHDIYNAVYDHDEAERRAFSIWGIEVDVQDPTLDPRVSVVLMKFLRAKSLDVHAAEEMLIDTLKWRKEVDIDRLFAKYSESIKKSTGYRRFGQDKTGCPVYYCSLDSDWGRFRRDKYLALQKQIGFKEYTWRTWVDFEHTYQIVKISDLRELLLSKVLSELGRDLQSISKRYPDLEFKSIAINSPCRTTNYVFHWNKFFGTMPKASKGAKQQLLCVGTNKALIAYTLLTYVDADQLPQQLGGNAPGFRWPGEK